MLALSELSLRIQVLANQFPAKAKGEGGADAIAKAGNTALTTVNLDGKLPAPFGRHHPLDVLGDAEAVLLALERDVGDRQAFLAEGVDDQLRLVRRDDLVFQALKENHRCRDPIQEVNRGPLSIDVPLLGPAADQTLVVHRLKLVGVAVEDLQVADAEVAGPGLEIVRRR